MSYPLADCPLLRGRVGRNLGRSGRDCDPKRTLAPCQGRPYAASRLEWVLCCAVSFGQRKTRRLGRECQALASATGWCRLTPKNGWKLGVLRGANMNLKKQILSYFTFTVTGIAAAGLLSLISAPARAQQAAVAIDNDDIQFELHIVVRSEEHTSELQSHLNLVCRLLL